MSEDGDFHRQGAKVAKECGNKKRGRIRAFMPFLPWRLGGGKIFFVFRAVG